MNTRTCFAIAALAAVLASGCATRPVSAPVIERLPAQGPVSAVGQKPPVAAPTAVPGAPAKYYVVRRGDTLYSIALEHGADYRDVARWNNLDDATKISVGQALRVTPPDEAVPPPVAAASGVEVGAARGAGPVESRPLDASVPGGTVVGDGSTKTWPKALRLPYSSSNVALLSKEDSAPATKPAAIARVDPRPEPAPPPTPTPSGEARDPDAIEFIWPAKGRLLAGFSEPNNKGVDIGGQLGDAVVAAAPGRVMYTGTGIRGYGKLIVIKHENGFNSVYAHNREILVKEGQSVARGEKIAELGNTDADKPMLHFEIRKSGKPVDPAKYLPTGPS